MNDMVHKATAGVHVFLRKHYFMLSQEHNLCTKNGICMLPVG